MNASTGLILPSQDRRTEHLTDQVADTPATHKPRLHRWKRSSLGLICLLWAALHLGGLWSPGLLDDVDSVYIEVAREMLQRHDFVTPMVDGIRFFDKPPLMYWVAAGSMRIFGEYDWAARLPLAVLTLALFLATYALGIRFFARTSPATHPDRGALYSALALGTAIGPYLYTRFFIPDILVTLWMVLGVHLFLIGLARARLQARPSETRESLQLNSSPLLPMLGFAVVLAANVLTKGLIGLVLPLGFIVLYFAFSRQLSLIPRLYPGATIFTFLLFAAPWHILVAVRNPAIPLPPGLGLPSHGGWAWFYLYNEHIARFLSRRIPHDYGQVPLLAFWALAALWIFPWIAFLPSAVIQQIRSFRDHSRLPSRQHEAALTCLTWTSVVLGFFSFSARQEYYSLPALPALALMIGGFLGSADVSLFHSDRERNGAPTPAEKGAFRSYTHFLLPLTLVAAVAAIYLAIAAGHVATGTDIADLLRDDRSGYDLSLGHMFDLTEKAMGLFRGPLVIFALAMLGIGPASWFLRRSSRTFAANLTLAGSSMLLLLAIHGGLARFYPKLGSKALANAIVRQQTLYPRPDDLILIDGELTDGSTLLFYTRQPVHLVEGRVNGTWYGSFWPDASHVFETTQTLHQQWAGPRRLFLLTPNARARTEDLLSFGEVHLIAQAGGKTVLANLP